MSKHMNNRLALHNSAVSWVEAVLGIVLVVERHAFHFRVAGCRAKGSLGSGTVADGTAGRVALLGARCLATLELPAGQAAAHPATGGHLDGGTSEAFLWHARLVVTGHAFADGTVVRVLHHFARVSNAAIRNGWARVLVLPS